MEVKQEPIEKELNLDEQFINDGRWQHSLRYEQYQRQEQGLSQHFTHQAVYQHLSKQQNQDQQNHQQQEHDCDFRQVGDYSYRRQHEGITQQQAQSLQVLKQQHKEDPTLPLAHQQYHGQDCQQHQQEQIHFTQQQQNNHQIYSFGQQHGMVDLKVKNENMNKVEPIQRQEQMGENITAKIEVWTGREQQLGGNENHQEQKSMWVKEENMFKEQEQNVHINEERIVQEPQYTTDPQGDEEHEEEHDDLDMEQEQDSDPEWQDKEQEDESSEELEQSDEYSPERKKETKVTRTPREKRKYPCQHCNKTFPSQRRLASHTSSHRLQCFVCDKKFRHQIELDGHMRDHEGVTTPYWCERCDKKYDKFVSLKKHRAVCGRFECSECKKVFCSKLYFKDHLATHRDDNKNRCEICGKHFSAPASKKIHMTLHRDETPLECDVCGEQFKYKVRLTYHMKKHSAEGNQLKCVVCCVTLNGKASYDEHMEKHNNNTEFECKFCVKRFDRLSRRAGHEGRHLIKTGSSDDPKEVNEDVDAFDCPECQLSFTEHQFLEDHLRDSHDVSSDVSSSETRQRKKSPYFECNICERLFNTSANLDAHYLNAHCKEDQPFIESHNTKRSGSSDRFNSLSSENDPHPSSTFSSAGDKHYICELCNMTVDADTVSYHMRDHGEKKFVCRFCGMKFLHVGNVKRHLSTHSHEENHECVLCNLKFRSYKNLQKHKNRHHGKKSDRIRNHECDQCGKAFMSSYHLQRHRSSHKTK